MKRAYWIKCLFSLDTSGNKQMTCETEVTSVTSHVTQNLKKDLKSLINLLVINSDRPII